MVKDQEFLEKKASYCLDLAKKLGATDVSVNVGSSISETVNFRNKKLDESNRSDNLGVDIGLGLTVKTPLGPVRLDYAIPRINNKFDYNSGQVQLGVQYLF